MPKVSVVIPCYNQGQYVDEAVDSVLNQAYQDFEIIIVNDGSTDDLTNNLLKNYDKPKTRVIQTNNQGLASARNNGIKEAKGEYILPLDADDKIGKEYLEEAVKILDENPGIGIVYCRAECFGVVERKWELPEYCLDDMLLDNIIFCSGFFRKNDWEKVGGYNPQMVYGWEDYDFWLSLIELEVLVYRIPRVLFYYRTLAGSMVKSKTIKQKIEMFIKIFRRHQDLFTKNINIWIDKLVDDKQDSVAQLFIDTGLGFNEKQTISRIVIGDEIQVEFDLCEFCGIKMLRFDPVNDYCAIHINTITVIRKDSLTYEIEDYQTNAIHQENGNLIFTTNDPGIWFSLPENNKLEKIVISLEYLSIGNKSFDYLLKYQNDLIINQKQLIQGKEQLIQGKEQLIHEKDKLIHEKDKRTYKIESELISIKQSRIWRTSMFLKKVLLKIPGRRIRLK